MLQGDRRVVPDRDDFVFWLFRAFGELLRCALKQANLKSATVKANHADEARQQMDLILRWSSSRNNKGEKQKRIQEIAADIMARRAILGILSGPRFRQGAKLIRSHLKKAPNAQQSR